jgi:uncharacterized membrane protein
MTLLIAGVALWWLAHLFRRIAPGARAALGERPGKAVVAAVLVLALVLMVIGYRRAAFEPVWDPPGWGLHLNNLLMLVAVILLGMGQSKGRMRAWLRHPMLTGVAVWAVAHLIVPANGDLASLILFGGIGVWALAEMLVVNAATGAWTRPAPGPAAGDVRLLAISVAVFAAIALIHWFVLGVRPFPG